MLKTNIAANLLGSGWIALLTLIVTPLQLRILGMEAYGIVGLIAILQIIFGTLDLGLSAAITQSVAADKSERLGDSAPLLNSTLTVYAVFAFCIVALLGGASGWLAVHWLKPRTLSSGTVLFSIRMIGLYVALRWPVAFYTGLLTGLQRMDLLNALKAGAATLRLVGGVIVILLYPSITAFLTWSAIAAGIELAAYSIVSHRCAPALKFKPSFSVAAVRSIWRFSMTMAVIAVLSMVVTQIDRLFVSKLLSLEALGYYTLAYTSAIGISLLQVSINSASLPAFARAFAHGPPEALTRLYDRTSELMSFVIALPCFALIFFGRDLLTVWVGSQAAAGATFCLAILLFGFFLNASVSNAYLVAVATRRATIPAWVNAIGAALYAPLLYWLIVRFGTVGAACGWALLNVYYTATLVVLVHRRILCHPLLPWLRHNLAIPILLAFGTFGMLKWVSLSFQTRGLTWLALGSAGLCYALASYCFMSPGLRSDVVNFIRQSRLFFITRVAAR